MDRTEEATVEVHVEEREVEVEVEERVKEKLKVEPEPGVEVEGPEVAVVEMGVEAKVGEIVVFDV